MNSRYSKKILVFLFCTFSLLFVACEKEAEVYFSDEITIAYAEPLSSYSPLSYEAKDRKYMANIYESLVTFDKSFNTKTALAVAWGRLDDNTWDFRLREGVTFHDGSGLDADDVIYSLNLARQDDVSDLGSLLSSIVRVEKIGLHRLEIETSQPDPLLLNKLTNVYMVPEDYKDFSLPIGSGAYRYLSASEADLSLERFDKYWGPAPFFPVVKLRYEPDPVKRMEGFISGEVDVLANVPPQFVNDLKGAKFDVLSFPSLELSFLMLNTELLLGDANLRTLVWSALRGDYAEILGSGYLLPSSQFAAAGIAGYLPAFEARLQEKKTVEDLRKNYDELVLNLDVPEGLQVFADLVVEDLAAFDVDLNVNVHPINEFESVALSGRSEMYFFGWKHDLGDVSDFYESVVHSQEGQFGAFNGINYANPDIDGMIEELAVTHVLEERNLLFKEIAELLIEEKVILPLFESTLLYSFNPALHWDIRLDGQILASEIFGNVVK